MDFHKTCKTLPIYNFKELVKTGDFRFLVKGFDEFENNDLVINPIFNIELAEIYKDIIYEYAELTFNNKILSNYKTKVIIKELTFRYNTAYNILNLYSEYLDSEILELLNKIGWKFYKVKDIDIQLNQIVKSMKGLKTRIDLMQIKYDAKFKENESKIEIVDNIDSDSIELEIGLKLSYSINTRTTSVSKWIGMWNVLKIRSTKK